MGADTKTVDVLAVLALARECLRNSSQQTPDGLAIHSAVAQVIPAIAELIEADRGFGAAERELNDDTLTSDEKNAVSWPRYYAARERRAAALRAVGGAK